MFCHIPYTETQRAAPALSSGGMCSLLPTESAHVYTNVHVIQYSMNGPIKQSHYYAHSHNLMTFKSTIGIRLCSPMFVGTPNQPIYPAQSAMVNWVELVGPNLVASLAKQTDVDLTSGIVDLLEKFGDCVERESRTRHLRYKKFQRVTTELRDTFQYVAEEVESLRHSTTNVDLRDSRHFYVHRHNETRLPVVGLRMKTLPEIIVDVSRHYASANRYHHQHHNVRLVSFGLRTKDYCRGRLTGAVAQAVNMLTEKCKQAQWRLSVSDIITSWIHFVGAIRKEDRIASELAHVEEIENNKKRPRDYQRQTGRWKARKLNNGHASTTRETSDDRDNGRNDGTQESANGSASQNATAIALEGTKSIT